MSQKLLTKDYVDAKVNFIGTYQAMDGRSIGNSAFSDANVVIAFVKHTNNTSRVFAFHTERASYQGETIDGVYVGFTFNESKQLVCSNSSGWYFTGVLCIK